jgi:hypothetical protein
VRFLGASWAALASIALLAIAVLLKENLLDSK